MDFKGILVAATRGGRVYRSTDGGGTYSVVADFSGAGLRLHAMSGASHRPDPTPPAPVPPRGPRTPIGPQY